MRARGARCIRRVARRHRIPSPACSGRERQNPIRGVGASDVPLEPDQDLVHEPCPRMNLRWTEHRNSWAVSHHQSWRSKNPPSGGFLFQGCGSLCISDKWQLTTSAERPQATIGRSNLPAQPFQVRKPRRTTDQVVPAHHYREQRTASDTPPSGVTPPSRRAGHASRKPTAPVRAGITSVAA